jgi:hypothetical protein
MSQSIRLRRVGDTLDGSNNTVEPLALADAINYLKLEVGDDDTLVSDLVTAARQQCEVLNNRSFITTRWELTFGHFPLAGTWPGPLFSPGLWPYGGYIDPRTWAIRLPRPPLISVDSISYTDLSGNVQAIDPAGVSVVVSPGTPGYLTPAYGSPFPWTRPGIAAVTIGYTAGYGTDPELVPRTVVMAIRLLVATYYANRSADVKVPDAARRLLDCTDWGGYG